MATEIYIVKSYKSMGAFVGAVRKHLAKILGEYPEDVLTACYSSNEDMGSVIRRTGKYFYEDRQMNIDVNIDTHIYLYEQF